MKRKLLIILCLLSGITFAQLPDRLIEIQKTQTLFKKYDGSIWKHKKLMESTVFDQGGGKYTTKLRYNVYLDVLESYTYGEKENSSLIQNEKVSAQIDGEHFYYREFQNKRGLARKGYFILVDDQKSYRVYKRYTLDIKDDQSAAASGVVVSSSKYEGTIRLVETYFVEDKGVILELPRKKKDLLVTFHDQAPLLKAFIKKEKIKVKRQEDLLKLIAKYDDARNGDQTTYVSILHKN